VTILGLDFLQPLETFLDRLLGPLLEFLVLRLLVFPLGDGRGQREKPGDDEGRSNGEQPVQGPGEPAL